MNKKLIYIVDDDLEDEDLIREVFRELNYEINLKFFITAEGLLNELSKNGEEPFIIISDINLPRMDGFQLRQKILEHAELSNKTIPFIFWSTTASDAQIKRAYDLSAHGFIIKAHSYSKMKEQIEEIIKYWTNSLAPHVK